jgi:hypothetical protein
MSGSIWFTDRTVATSTLSEAARELGPFRSLARIGGEGCVVEITDGSHMLGVRSPDRSRAILVVTEDGELAVALRDAVPSGMAVVRDARCDDAADIAAACLPWPWMVVGTTMTMSPGLVCVLRHRPVVTLWLGQPPAGLPVHARVFDRPSALLQAVRDACAASVGGMRLAPGSGVELGDGTLVRNATLEALVAAYPSGFALPTRTFRTVTAALARHRAGWTAVRDSAASMALSASAPHEIDR